jgi:hypothetical protein
MISLWGSGLVTETMHMRLGGRSACRDFAVVALWASVFGVAPRAFAQAPTCPQTSPATSQATTVLQQFAEQSNAGVVYENASSTLRLNKAGGNFTSTTLPVTDNFNVAAAADFDKDGWTDMVVGSSGDNFVRFYRNRTFENPAPNWSDPTKIRTPKFVRTRDIEASSGAGGDAGMVAADFNNDGNPDFFYYRNDTDNTNLDVQRIYLGKGDGSFNSAYNAMSSGNVGSAGYFNWSSTNAIAFDYNRDGWLDIVFGTKNGSGNGNGSVAVLVNGCSTAWTPTTKCASNPTFNGQYVITGVDFGPIGVNALTIGDFTNDGIADLVVGSPSYCTATNRPVRLYPGLSGGGFSNSYQGLSTQGAATVMLAADFSLDGKVDLIYGSDEHNCGSHLGGSSFYLKNDGDNQPFSAGNTQQLSSHQAHATGALYDFDLGVVLDYDQDPDRTPDMLIADGNDSGTFFVFANRVVSSYVDCGEVASGTLDLGPLAAAEMVVTGARLTPVQTLPTGTSVNYYLSNEEPPNWQLASPCTDNAAERCATFPRPVGRSVRWKAVMCSNATRNQTPTITTIGIKFDYTPAKEHYRAGVVVSDGVSYVGAFRQPGQRGHFYAINAGLSTKYWDFAAKLDAMADSDRKLYTATTDGLTRLELVASSASDSRMQATLGVAATDQAAAIIDWVRQKRFGYTSTTLAQSKLGAVESSTPAIMTPPGLPSWYVHAAPADRQQVDTFITANAKRPQLVFFGSKDGILHAVRTIPTSISHANSGREVWGFTPAKVAFGFAADRAAGTATSYPDGSPSLADVRINGEMRTVAVVNGGNGSKGVFALDVTSTYTIASANDPTSAITAVAGPTPLWHALPGSADAGQSYAKPAIARVKVSGVEKYLAIMASGRASENATAPWTKGREVVAVDMATGGTAWQFTARCPVTSDVVIFETDDDAETGNPEIDGYADRAVFADYCGYVYKLPLGTPATGGRLTGLGAISTGANDSAGNPIKALFSVATSLGGLGSERPIAGTIGARADATGRLALFFGTGGDEQFDVTKQNAFYAIYADSGAVRSKLLGSCLAGRCDKFYGGVVVTSEQVFMTRAKDPPVGTLSCDFGNSALVALRVNDANGSFTTDFTTALSSTTQSGLFGDAGALYLATLSGDIVRVGTPRATSAGGDSNAGNAPGGADGAGAGTNITGDPVSFLGWRQMI